MSSTPSVEPAQGVEIDDNVDDYLTVIDKSRLHDRLRYECPHGHVTWRHRSDHVWCRICAKHRSNGADIEPIHDWVRDKKTEEQIHHAELRVLPR